MLFNISVRYNFFSLILILNKDCSKKNRKVLFIFQIDNLKQFLLTIRFLNISELIRIKKNLTVYLTDNKFITNVYIGQYLYLDQGLTVFIKKGQMH